MLLYVYHCEDFLLIISQKLNYSMSFLSYLILFIPYSVARSSALPSNAELVKTLRISGDAHGTIEQIPFFESKRDETMWKLNYAKKTLKKAKEIERLAKRAAIHFGYYDGNKQAHSEVKHLLGHVGETMMNAGEKMGFEYEKF